MTIWSSQIPSRVHDLFQWFFRVINWICAWLKVLNHEHFQTALIITTQLSLSYFLFEGWKKYMIMYITYLTNICVTILNYPQNDWHIIRYSNIWLIQVRKSKSHSLSKNKCVAAGNAVIDMAWNYFIPMLY